MDLTGDCFLGNNKSFLITEKKNQQNKLYS